MKNGDIVYLVSHGILEISNHTLSPEHAYKVFKFKKWIRKSVENVQESEVSLQKECGITDGAAFDSLLLQLRGTENRSCEEQAKLREMETKLGKYLELRDAMYNDTTEVDGITPIPYNEWFLLQNENTAVKLFNGEVVDALSGRSEEILENILWTLPE